MPKTLLLADDSVTIQKVVGITFANEDIDLVTVDNGDEALTRAREVKPDLVLADVAMPGLSGYELCRAIRSEPDLAHIPVLLLSGTFETFDEQRAADAGANGHIAKPFEAQALIDQVNSLLAEAEAAAPPPPLAEPEVDAEPLVEEAPETFPPLQADEEFAEEDAPFPAPVTPPPDEPPMPLVEEFQFSEASEISDEELRQEPVFDPPLAATATEEAEPVPLEEFAPAGFGTEAGFATEPPLSASAPSHPQLSGPVSGGFTEEYPFEEEASIPSGAALEPSVPGPPELQPREEASGPLLAKPAFDPPLQSPAGLTPTPVSAPRTDDEEDLPWAETLDDDDPIITPIPPEAALHESDLPEADALFEESLHFAKDPADSAPTLEPEPVPFEASDLPEPYRSPEPAPDESFSEGPQYPSPEAIPETFSRRGRTEDATWHTPAAAVDPEVLRQALEKVAWEAFGSISKEIVEQIVDKIERIAWEVVPQLAERLILEEIARLRDDPPSE